MFKPQRDHDHGPSHPKPGNAEKLTIHSVDFDVDRRKGNLRVWVTLTPPGNDTEQHEHIRPAMQEVKVTVETDPTPAPFEPPLTDTVTTDLGYYEFFYHFKSGAHGPWTVTVKADSGSDHQERTLVVNWP
jgi:hypothetical protein